MRPIKLLHDKPLTDIKYNHDGDMLFTAAKVKDSSIHAWWADNGERIGTYDGHNGAIFSIDVDRTSTRLISGAADTSVRMWDVQTGKEYHIYTHNTTVRCVSFSQGDRLFLTVTDASRGYAPEIMAHKVAEDNREQVNSKKSVVLIEDKSIEQNKTVINKAIWGYHNEQIISANSDGTVRIYSTEASRHLNTLHVHKGSVMSLQYDKYRSMFVTASKDGSAKIIDTRTFEVVKEFDTGRPLNAASLSPLMDHLIVGGGEQADAVTQSNANASHFKMRFYHTIFGDELGSIMGHFGPVNCLTFSPDGRSFASGSEDGSVRLHYFDQSYFDRTDEITKYDSKVSQTHNINKV
eukprot:TRINITY_DN12782_c0_g1_i1.p1 TRINITY_DN12782_c0_g1~~TRINITY_DN12782_c0_g1_i1.p1  ORF type:complete len:350 (-),score=52.08 TRINITY_DN12782_c0_g1_i1:34-1083(-)